MSTVKSAFSAVIPPSWMVFLYKATITYAHQHFTSSQFKINKSPTRSYVVGNANRVTTLSSASLRWSASRSTLPTASSSSSTLLSASSFELNVVPADLHRYTPLTLLWIKKISLHGRGSIAFIYYTFMR